VRLGDGSGEGLATAKGSSELLETADGEPVGNGRKRFGLRTFCELRLEGDEASERGLVASGELVDCAVALAAATEAAEAPVSPTGSLLASFSSASARRCEKGPNAAVAVDCTDAAIDAGGGLPPPVEVGGVPAEKYELPGLAARPSPLPPELESGEKERMPRTGDRLELA
jgi:hypothetical protein